MISREELLEAEIGMLREKLSDALAGGLPHRSDCAVYQAPAYEPGPCNCGVGVSADDNALDLIRKIREHNGWTRVATDADAVNLVKSFMATVALDTGLAQSPARATINAAADEVVSRVVEWDDRTSPDDFPEALLITPSELHRELVRFAEDIGACSISSTDQRPPLNKKTRCNACNLLAPCGDPMCPNALVTSKMHSGDE